MNSMVSQLSRVFRFRGLGLHPHEFLVGFHQLVPDLDHQGEGQPGLFRGDHDVVDGDVVALDRKSVV